MPAQFDITRSGPFEGVALMPVPRCDQCQHWEMTDLHTGPCRHPALSAGVGSSVWTAPDFGCVMFLKVAG
jgi:hypothetical protein